MFILTPLIFATLHVFSSAADIIDQKACETVVTRFDNFLKYSCFGLTTLRVHLENAPSNTTIISVVNSDIPIIPNYSFTKFGGTLHTLYLHKCNIKVIESHGFAGLVYLQKLILWENNLTWISSDWFATLTNLRHLDISFNKVLGIDYGFYGMLPELEEFYFDYNDMNAIDYNMFSLLPRLKKVKFGKNPWIWGYRILLAWQLDNQRVDYRDDWEEWGWMISVARECQDSGQAILPYDTSLHCIIQKLFRTEIGNDRTISDLVIPKTGADVQCSREALALIQCSGSSDPLDVSIRKAFETLTASLTNMDQPNGKFKSRAL